MNAAHLGGMIPHDEIRPEVAAIQSEPLFEAPPFDDSEEDDESP